MKKITITSVLLYSFMLVLSMYASTYLLSQTSIDSISTYNGLLFNYLTSFDKSVLMIDSYNANHLIYSLFSAFGLSVVLLSSLFVGKKLIGKTSFGQKVDKFLENQIVGIFSQPSKPVKMLLLLIPFVLSIGSYVWYSNYKTDLEPKQKTFPVVTKIGEKFIKNLTTPDKRIDRVAYKNVNKMESALKEAEEKGLDKVTLTLRIDGEDQEVTKSVKMLKFDKFTTSVGASKVYTDAKSSLYRLIYAMTISAFVALVIGLLMGLFKSVEATLEPFLNFFGAIQPVVILPIIMILAGVDDFGKIVFIFTVLTTTLLLATYREVKSIPQQIIIKGMTFGAGRLKTIFKVLLPQVLPRFIDVVRSNLYLGWIFLLSAEMISAESGLGYRVMLFKRSTSMDQIIGYVIIITVLSLIINYSLKYVNQKMFPWYSISK